MYWHSITSQSLTLGCWWVGGYHGCNTVLIGDWRLEGSFHVPWGSIQASFSSLASSVSVTRGYLRHISVLFGSSWAAPASFHSSDTGRCLFVSPPLLFLAEQHGDGDMNVFGQVKTSSRLPSCQSASKPRRRSIMWQPHWWWFHSFGILALSKE